MGATPTMFDCRSYERKCRVIILLSDKKLIVRAVKKTIFPVHTHLQK